MSFLDGKSFILYEAPAASEICSIELSGLLGECVFLTRVVHKVKSALHGFMWSENSLGRGGAKVRWDEVCLSRSKGCLDLRYLNSWNRSPS